MLTCERLIVHFVAQQTLRVPGRRHVQRFVVIIRTLDGDKSRRGIAPDQLQKIRQPRPAKAPDNVPSLDANMPRVLPEFGQRLDLRQRVVSRLLHCAANGEGPIVEIHSGIVDVIAIDRKPAKGVSSESSKVRAKWPERKSRAEAQSLKASPVLSSGICSFGMAKAPSASTGLSLSSSRRFMRLNCLLSVRKFI